MTSDSDSNPYTSPGTPLTRRKFLTATGVAVAGGLAVSQMAMAPPAIAQTPSLLPLLSDLSATMPPTQVNARCSAAGALDLWWLPGSTASGTLRYQVFVNGALIKTVAGLTTSLTGLPKSGALSVTMASLASTSDTSELTSQVVRSASAADDDRDNRPRYLIAERAFGGVSLRWAHGGPNRNLRPANYVVRSPSRSDALAVLDGSATSVFIAGLAIGVEVEVFLEARTPGMPTLEARNRIRVTPYGRELNSDRLPPTQPYGVGAQARKSAFLATWKPSTDSGGAVYAYKIYVNNQFTALVRGATKAELGPFPNDTQVRFRVSAVDLNGNESTLSSEVRITPRSTAANATINTSPRFSASGHNLLDPSGASFIPVGANVNGPDFIWQDATVGVSAAIPVWKWTAIRVNCGMRDHGALSQGYLYFVNNQLDSLVTEYTNRKVAVMIDQHSHLDGQGGQNLPIDAGSAGDPSGRSAEVAITDWWVEIAKRYGDNPYVWFNLVNEPGPDRAALDAQYRRMMARIRAVAPNSVIVLDAAAFANDIPTNTAPIGTGPIAKEHSFVLSNGPALVRDFGPASGYGPIVFSVHLYARWAVNWGASGMLTVDQLAARIRDYVTRTKAAGLPLLIGELGVEAYAVEADSRCVAAALYSGGTKTVSGVNKITGVLVEQQIGVFPWHVARTSGMSVALPSKNWDSVQGRADTNPAPHAGTGLWDMVH